MTSYSLPKTYTLGHLQFVNILTPTTFYSRIVDSLENDLLGRLRKNVFPEIMVPRQSFWFLGHNYFQVSASCYLSAVCILNITDLG